MPQPSKHTFESLSYKVIGACIDVQRQIGTYCMEVDYQRALEIAFSKFGVQFQREVEIPIAYDGVVVTKRRVDFVCAGMKQIDYCWKRKRRKQFDPRMQNKVCST